MENLIRLLMRFILVPLGYLAAAIAGALVVVVWSRLVDVALNSLPDTAYVSLAFAIGGPMLVLAVMVLILMPALIGILISEAFAIRSWIFHVLNGIASVWLGWQLYDSTFGKEVLSNEPLVVIAAGIAGGFAYWAVAGFSAGFYKPIFRSNPPPSVPATTQ